MSEQEGQSLEELDAADEQEVERIQDVVLRVIEQRRPASIFELSVQVRAEAGYVANSLIRAAILRLLNANQIHLGTGRGTA